MHRTGSWPAFVMAVATAVVATVLNWPQAPTPAVPASRPAADLDGPPITPIGTDCSGGRVFLTFDDGPGPGTALVLTRLAAANLHATFFVIGDHIAGNEGLLRREQAEGHHVENHSYHHVDLVTGVDLAGVRRSPWGPSEIENEFLRTNRAIMAAGVPRPTEYRPPYGSVDLQVDRAARRQGLRLVMPWSDDDSGNIVDSKDTEAGVAAADVVRNLTPGLQADAIIAMHDGETASAQLISDALPGIVDAMAARHLCSSIDLRADATGDVLTGTGKHVASGS